MVCKVNLSVKNSRYVDGVLSKSERKNSRYVDGV